MISLIIDERRESVLVYKIKFWRHDKGYNIFDLDEVIEQF